MITGLHPTQKQRVRKRKGAQAQGCASARVRKRKCGACQRHARRGRRRDTLERIASGDPLFATTGGGS